MTYLLICAVAIVWGIIVYRIFSVDAGNEQQPSFASAKNMHEPYDQYVAKNDTFRLVLDYRDPFLGKIIQPSVITDQPVKDEAPVKLNQATPPVAPVINWGLIKYAGYITNPKTKKMVAIVSVNGEERMIAEGESFHGLKLMKNKKDSILVKWQGKQKYIKQ